jgi:hypothetical protein
LCLRIRVNEEIEADKNVKYVKKLLDLARDLQGLSSVGAQEKIVSQMSS